MLKSHQILLSLFCLVVINSCRGSSGGGDSEAGSSSLATLTGVVKSSTGSQSEMASWVIVFVERDTGLAHFGELNTLGSFEVPYVQSGTPITALLLDSQYRRASVMSSPSDASNLVRQYFTFSSNSLPAIAHQGPVIKFSSSDGLSWTNNTAVDTDQDGIPNGVDTTSSSLKLADIDGDGLNQNSDFDLDNDGLLNWFDDDDDNDNIIDVLDTDANGDEVADLSQELGDLYFSKQLDFLSVQVVQTVQSDSSLASNIIFTSKVAANTSLSQFKIVSANELLSGAMVDGKDWDGTLSDDGVNDDGNANDRLYARNVTLEAGKSPKSNQVVFFQIVQSSGETSSYAYSFPALTTGVVTGTYSGSVVTKSGTPFPDTNSYVWIVQVYDANGTKVYSSESIQGAVSSFTIPSGTLEAGRTYTGQIAASTIDRINSYPSWTIKSLPFNLQ